MKYLVLVVLMMSFSVLSHDGDEEVKVKNAPRFGGRVSAVMDEHHHDEMVYMSEIIISDQDIVRLYFYDLNMKDISLDKFPDILKMNLTYKKLASPQILELKKNKKLYEGKLPKGIKRPFNLSTEFKANSKEFHLTIKALD